VSEQFRRASAIADFRQARQKAGLRQVLATLTGKSTELLAYDSVTRQLDPLGSAERGLQEIPIDAIAGSVGRHTDFTRDFLPRHDSDQERWAKIKMLAADPGARGLPPIKVYQVGAAYFIIDGHHRVSVARQMGVTHIQAYVTEIRTRAPLSANATPEEVIAKAQSVAFLDQTRLAERRPAVNLSLSTPGDASHLAGQVELHRQNLAAERGSEVSLPDAAEHWYDTVYEPTLHVLREQGLPRLYPNHTEAELYLIVSAHRRALEEALGWEITPELGAANLAATEAKGPQGPVARVGRRLLNAVVPSDMRPGPEAGAWRRERTTARYGDRLFADILVPVSGARQSWAALSLALQLAAREGARLHGLHVVSTKRRQTGAAAQAVREHFDATCREAGVAGSLAVEVGEIAPKICALSTLSDLVVLNLAHPPGKRFLDRQGSGFRTVVRRCPRPVLAVPGPAQPPGRIVLGYDGSPKAEEALFVAAYFAETWQTPLSVVTVLEGQSVTEATVAQARAYLEMHEVEAEYELRQGEEPADVILATAEAKAAGLILLGGYGANRVVEAVMGSGVDRILRQSTRPILICR
jgi:nucleotide-binding universal stress UspA family protein